MRATFRVVAVAVLCLVFVSSFTIAQSTSRSGPQGPNLIRISAAVSDDTIRRSGAAQATFALYAAEDSSAPLWVESQSVRVDVSGHYSALLGANSAQGVPVELFASGEVRWLGVTLDGREQPRMQLVSVPYALKSREADTLDGLSAADIVAQAAAIANPAATFSSIVRQNAAPLGASSKGTISPYMTTSALTATDFTDSNATQVVSITQNGSGYGLNATTGGTLAAVFASNTNTTSASTTGVRGESSATGTSSAGVLGVSNALTGTTYGVLGITSSTSGTALNGTATATTGGTIGLRGQANSTGGVGVLAAETASTGGTIGVQSLILSPSGIAAVFDNRGGGRTLSLRNNSVEKLGVDGAGNLHTVGTLTGIGSGLTGLNASNLATGTVPGAAVSGTYSNALTFSNVGNSFTGSGAGLTGVVKNVQAFAGSGLAYNLTNGTATYSLVTTCNAGDVLRWTGAAWVCDGNLAKRSISVVIGCDTCGALQDTDSQSAVWVNNASPMTITSIACYSDTASAPSVNLQRDDGTPADILSSPLLCTNSTSGTSSTSFNSGESTLNLGDKINFKMVTAGGSHRVTVVVSATVD